MRPALVGILLALCSLSSAYAQPGQLPPSSPSIEGQAPRLETSWSVSALVGQRGLISDETGTLRGVQIAHHHGPIALALRVFEIDYERLGRRDVSAALRTQFGFAELRLRRLGSIQLYTALDAGLRRARGIGEWTSVDAAIGVGAEWKILRHLGIFAEVSYGLSKALDGDVSHDLLPQNHGNEGFYQGVVGLRLQF